MPKVFVFYYNGVSTSWNGSVKTFMNYTKDKQIHLLYALECATPTEREQVRENMVLTFKNNQEGQDMLKFIMSGSTNKPAPEISIVSCVLTKKRRELCPICLDPMDDMSSMVVATTCRHVFCRTCIVPWAQKNKTCPVCRGVTEKALIHLGERDMKIASEIIEPTQEEEMPPPLPDTGRIQTRGTTERILRELNLID